MAQYVFNLIVQDFDATANIVAVPPILQFFATLNFFATGSYQNSIGQNYNISFSQPFVSRSIKTVTNLLEERLGNIWIKFPLTVEEKHNIKQQFMEATGFAGIVGAIDCTHVAILAPPDEHNYLNRKHFHSINVQLICTYDLRILNINARYPGATHDAFIWRHSFEKQYMEAEYNQGDQNSWLIGDSAYPLQPWLMTPFQNPQPNTPEARYNHAHVHARNCIERCNGLLKSRFRCLLNKERMLRYSPERCGKIINSCAILHNICVSGNLELGDDLLIEEDMNNEMFQNNVQLNNVLREGQAMRRQILNMYFRN